MNKIPTASSNLIQTKVGLINQDWNIVPIGKVIKLSQYGLSISTDENGTIPILGMKHLVEGKVKIDNLSYVSINEEEKDKFCLKKGDILLNRTNSYELVGKVALFNHNDKLIVFASYLVRFQFDKNKVLPEFVNFFLNSYPAQHYLKRLATKGVSQVNINPSVFRKLFLLPIPPLEEQRKIAEILSTWDNAIAITEKLIAAKQKLKKGLIQKILSSSFWTGRKESSIALENEWKYQQFNLFFDERKETSSNLEKYPLYSLTIEEGLIEKPERYNREFLLKDQQSNQYKIVYPGDFVYNPMNLRFGAIALSQLNYPIAISAYYNVLSPNLDLVNPLFIFNVLKSPRMIYFYNSFGKGSLEEKKRVHLSTFLRFKIPLASIQEQNNFAYRLNTFNKDINLYVEYLEKIKKQKRGLMQKLLTGEWRVKTETVVETKN